MRLAISRATFETSSFGCDGCEANCDIVRVSRDGTPIAYWGGACVPEVVPCSILQEQPPGAPENTH